MDYQLLIDEAMLGVVKKILMNTKDNGLLSGQCFYISFRTDRPDVILSQNVKVRYPKEITIVLQHQFDNLAVFDDKFCVSVSFGGITERIEVPFIALTGFIDPLASFNLQFAHDDGVELFDSSSETQDKIRKINISKKKTVSKKTPTDKQQKGDIIAIDAFLKKNKPNDKG